MFSKVGTQFISLRDCDLSVRSQGDDDGASSGALNGPLGKFECHGWGYDEDWGV